MNIEDFDTVTITGYWSGIKTLVTPEVAARQPSDIIEMQTIDADCNDCRHFQRGAMQKVPGLTFFYGHCKRYDRPTKAYPGQYSGHKCFEHRRAVKTS